MATPQPVNRWLAACSGITLATMIVLNVPILLRMPFDCDSVLYDIFARNMGDGQILYRDMLDNRPPAMTLIHYVFRSLFGGSIEAMHIFDFVLVGTAITLLSRFAHPNRWDWQLFTGTVLSAFFLSTNELCHAQSDMWLCVPLFTAITWRRAQLARLIAGNSHAPMALLEGFIWGLAVWIKPHILVTGMVVWLAGACWCLLKGTRLRTLARDFVPLLIGGSVCGLLGMALMMKLGIWDLYFTHVRTWVGEYLDADFYRPYGIWAYRLFYLWSNSPWSLVYLFAVPLACFQFVRMMVSRNAPPTLDDAVASREHRLLLYLTLVAWSIQAWGFQHMFDYVHLGGVMLAWAFVFQLTRAQPTLSRSAGMAAFFVFLAMTAHINVLVPRLHMWLPCVGTPTTELRQQLSMYRRMNWVACEEVSDFLRSQNTQQDEVAILADTALPVWLNTGLKQPTRYYLFYNNLMSFPSHRDEILGSFAANTKQRFVVVDVRLLHRIPPIGGDWDHPATWPITRDWRKPRNWESRIVFRSEQYLVVSMSSAELPQFVSDTFD